jgi:hypothetical protein
MQFGITGSVSNDKRYTAMAVSNIPPFNVITLDSTVIDEVGVAVTITLPAILNRDAVVTDAPEVCPSPETIFNVVFTPKSMLLLHGRWLRSILTGFDLNRIKFQSGDKNTKFRYTTTGGVIIDEDIDVEIGDLGDRLFFNYYHEFESLVPIDIVELLEDNPNRCFRFYDTEREEFFTGFNIKSAFSPNTLEPQEFKLLSSPLNDISKLIY